AAWQRDVWENGRLDATERYWRDELQRLPAPLALPADHPRQSRKSYAGGTLPFEIPADVADAVTRYARERGGTPFLVVPAAFHLLLHRYTGETDVLVGTDAANRQPRETEAMHGFFINQLVIRTPLDPHADANALFDAVRAKTLKAYEHEAMP